MNEETRKNPAAMLDMDAPQGLTSKCDGAMAKSSGFGKAGI